MGCFVLVGRVFDTKRHSNVKRRAEYRRISVYYKGVDKFKAEKARRRRVVDLQDEGLSIRQIAQRLGVSERTVKRDFARVEPYVKKQWTQLQREVDEESLERFMGLSFKAQLKEINRLMKWRRKIAKTHTRKTLTVTIDLDSVFAGRYGVKFKPDLPINIAENGKITLELETGGLKQAIARIYVGEIIHGSANLQTNQSMNDFVRPVLKGLTVMQSGEK